MTSPFYFRKFPNVINPSQWAKSPKKQSKGVRFTAFSAILRTGIYLHKLYAEKTKKNV